MNKPAANVLTLGKTPTSTVLKLSWPSILEQIAFTIFQFADTAMVAALGASATAAVGVVTPVLWLTNGLIAALAMGLSVQVAQAIGAEDYEAARRVIRQSFSCAVVGGGVLTIITVLLAPALPGMLGADPDIVPMASVYLRIVGYSLVADGVLMVFSAILRCMGNTRAPMIANASTIVLNIILNYFLIYPTRPVTIGTNTITMPGLGMGVAGAAWGTAISIVVAAMMVLYSMRGSRFGLSLEWDHLKAYDKKILQRTAHLGVPVALERATLALGQVAFIRIVATMGTNALAAHHLAVQAESLSYLPAFGFSVAATTLVGQAVGAGLKEDARRFGNIAARMGLICMILTGTTLFFGSRYLILFFTPDQEVVALGSMLLKIVAFAQPMQAFFIIYSGALRGAGDSRWPFYINLVGVWGIRIASACFFTFVLKLGLGWVWVAMLMDLCFCGFVCYRRFSRGKWYPASQS